MSGKMIDAIKRGFECEGRSDAEVGASVEKAVLDFLRQHFTVAYFAMGELTDIVGLEVLKELARRIGVERE